MILLKLAATNANRIAGSDSSMIKVFKRNLRLAQIMCAIGWRQLKLDLNDLEVDLVASFLRLLESHIPITGDGDKVEWRLKWSGG
ncbi:hypothetical protein SO802_030336 [Lithocarpus litseifolius]|uniref:Uncharacterized protein n=1 Tax=Lithocarpus litseifolius TaxID=425828 RepID=A0AAW2BHA5_9ROSI